MHLLAYITILFGWLSLLEDSQDVLLYIFIRISRYETMSFDNPFVSIVTPAYNAQATVGETIESVLSQTFTNFELIVVDDGSMDDTANVVHQFEDKRIKYLYQTHKERSEARNNGIKNAKGKYIAFLDADDTWLPEKLEKQMELFEVDPNLGLVYSDLYLCEGIFPQKITLYSRIRKLYRGYVPLRTMLEEGFIQSATPIVKREVFDKVGNFDSNLIPLEDYDMWMRIVAKYSIDFVDQPLAYYRIHSNRTSWKIMPEILFESTHKLIDKIETNFLSEGLLTTNDIIKGRSRIYYDYALGIMSRGEFAESKKSYMRSLRIYPYSIKTYVRLAQLFYLYTKNYLLNK